MKKLLLTFLFALVAMVTAQGQTYGTGVGPSTTFDSELTGVLVQEIPIQSLKCLLYVEPRVFGILLLPIVRTYQQMLHTRCL